MKNKKIFFRTIIGLILMSILLGVWISYQVKATTEFTIEDCPYDIEFVKLSTQWYFSMGIDTEGNLWGWGNTQSELLGEGIKAKQAPTIIKEGTTFKDVALGSSAQHALAIDTSGNLWAWGSNDNGELGDGTTTDSATPIKIKSGTKFKKIDAGLDHSLAIDESGNLWAWGRNSRGELGNGTTDDSSTPIKIASGTTFTNVSAGDMWSVAIDSEGNLWTWGLNSYGQLGDGTTDDSSTPIKIASGTTFKEIADSWEKNIAIDSEGNLWEWGGTSSDTPTKITSDVTFEKISCGRGGSSFDKAYFAIDSEGNLWSWGNNNNYWLGNGSNETVSEPQKVMEGKKFKEISAGQLYAIGIDTNGDSWSWGYHAYGAKGTGSSVPDDVPVRFTGEDYVVTFKNGEEIVKQDSVKLNGTAIAPLITKDGYTLSWDNKTYRNNWRLNNKCSMD